MITKLFEVRDSGTLIPVMAVRLKSNSEAESWLLTRSGYGGSPHDQGRYVLVCTIDGGDGVLHSDKYQWRSRAMSVAHGYISAHFDDLKSGDVIDVQYILGETSEKKQSERFR